MITELSVAQKLQFGTTRTFRTNIPYPGGKKSQIFSNCNIKIDHLK